MFTTIMQIIVPIVDIILATALLAVTIGLIFRLVYDFTDAPEWVEGIAVFLTCPQDFKEWKAEYKKDLEEEEE